MSIIEEISCRFKGQRSHNTHTHRVNSQQVLLCIFGIQDSRRVNPVVTGFRNPKHIWKQLCPWTFPGPRATLTRWGRWALGTGLRLGLCLRLGCRMISLLILLCIPAAGLANRCMMRNWHAWKLSYSVFPDLKRGKDRMCTSSSSKKIPHTLYL